MGLAESKSLSTSRVADALGLSVSTVKRWVDEGVLPAYKTAGGHRKLQLADVLALARKSDLPCSDLSSLIDTPVDSPVEGEKLAEPLYRALLAGAAEQVRMLILGYYRGGLPIGEIADQAIAPAMRRIGMDWQAGRIDVMYEHRATQLCAAALYELKAIIQKRAGKNRPRAVGGAVERDFSLLPTLLAEMVLLDAGWDAVNLGPNTPCNSFAIAVHKLQPRLLWITVSHLGSVDEFLSDYPKLYHQAEKAGVAVAIGGQALNETLRSKIPYTTYGGGLGHLSAFAHMLCPLPSQPRRGRPRTTR